VCGCGMVIQPFQNFQAAAGAACAGVFLCLVMQCSESAAVATWQEFHLFKVRNFLLYLRQSLMPEAATDLGTCSHPDCLWRGQRINYPKHKEGCGKPTNRRPGKHEGCTCCNFVPDLIAAPELSILQQTLAAMGQQRQVSLHAHLQGEFYRTAMIENRCVWVHCVWPWSNLCDALQEGILEVATLCYWARAVCPKHQSGDRMAHRVIVLSAQQTSAH